MPNTITIDGKPLFIGDRVIIGWRHWNGGQGARFGVVKKITASGYVYAGYSDEKFRGDKFPLYKRRGRGLGSGDYTHTLMLNTPENRAYYGMPETAPANQIFRKPAAETEAEVFAALKDRERQLLLAVGDMRKQERFAASTFVGLRAAKLITSGYPERLTEKGERVRKYADQMAAESDNDKTTE